MKSVLLSVFLCALWGVTAWAEPEWFIAVKAAYAREVKEPKDQPPQPAVPSNIPSADYNYGEYKAAWTGVSIVWDDVNGEALFVCGHNGGMPFGTMGSWALTDGGKTWRELKFASPILDPLRAKALAARQAAKDGEAAARGIYYAALDAAKEADGVKTRPAALIAEAIRRAKELAVLPATTTAAGVEKESMARAESRVGTALAALNSAHTAFDGGTLDAAALKHCFEAQWALDEAADCLSSSPAPRENASVVFDPAGKCVVLFGGSHHDFMRNDTWLYDCTRKSWRQLWPKTAPTARMGAAFSRTPDGKLVLSGGQTVLSPLV